MSIEQSGPGDARAKTPDVRLMQAKSKDLQRRVHEAESRLDAAQRVLRRIDHVLVRGLADKLHFEAYDKAFADVGEAANDMILIADEGLTLLEQARDGGR